MMESSGSSPFSWANRVSIDSKSTSDTISTSSLPTNPSPPVPVNAETSDNWRRGSNTPTAASVATTAAGESTDADETGGGWQKAEKKSDKAKRTAAQHSNSHHKSNYSYHKSNSTKSAQSSSPASITAATTPAVTTANSSAVTPTNRPAINSKDSSDSSSLLKAPTSWADDLGDDLGKLPSPTFHPIQTKNVNNEDVEILSIPTTPALTNSSETNSSTQAGTPPLESPAVAATAKDTLEQDSTPAVETPKPKQAAPVPKVNVWAVRKDQMAAAAAAANNSGSDSSTPKPQTKAGPTQPPTEAKSTKAQKPIVDKSQPKKEPKSEKKSNLTTTNSNANSAPANSDPNPRPTAVKANTAATKPAVKRVVEGWSGVKPVSDVPVAVLGADVESWPSPNEELAKSKDPKKPKAVANSTKTEDDVEEETNTKKKADKTKWVALPVEIHHTTTSNGRAFGVNGEKRAKQPKSSETSAAKPTDANSAKSTEKKPNSTKTPTENRKIVSANLPAKPPATIQTPKTNSKPSKTSIPTTNSTLAAPKTSAEIAAAAKADAANSSNQVIRPFADAGPAPSPTANSFVPNQPQDSTSASSARSTAAPARAGRGGNSSARGRGANRANFSARGGFHATNGSAQNHQQQNQFQPEIAHEFVDSINGFAAPAQSAPIVDPRVLDPTRYWLLGQLEWWFSLDNLCRDLFLRSKMDKGGWIDISIIASFNRIKNLTSDFDVVRDTMSFTPLLQVYHQFVRLRQNWPEWILPNAIPSRVDESIFLAEQQEIEARRQAELELLHENQFVNHQSQQTGQQFDSRVDVESRKSGKSLESEDETRSENGTGTVATTISTGSQTEEGADDVIAKGVTQNVSNDEDSATSADSESTSVPTSA